jgi:DNA repair exonuclease SbcCD ATPase subunit
MRDINFTEVGMKNFGPYIDPMVLAFPNNSLTLLTGPNGIGKTMALDAIPFTLYGITSKGAKGDDVVNNVIGRNCKTWVKFKVDQDKYKVIRYQKYSKVGNTVTISKNGGDPYKKGSKEVLPEIENLLCTKKSFMNTLMFGQKVKDFFTDLIDSDKKEIFRKILNLDRYQLFYKRAKDIVDEIVKSIVDTNNDIKVTVQLLQDSQNYLKTLSEQKNQYYNNREKEIKQLQQDIQSNKRMLDQWNKKLEILKDQQKQWKDLESKVLEIEKAEEIIDSQFDREEENLNSQKQLKISELKEDASKAKEHITGHWNIKIQEKNNYYINLKNKFSQKIEELLEQKTEINTNMNRAEDAINIAEIQINELNVGLNEATCPVCLQDITPECRKNLESKIKVHRDIIDKNQLIINNLKDERLRIFNQIQEVQANSEKAKQVLDTDVSDCKMFFKQQLNEAEEKLVTAIEKVNELSTKMYQQIKEKYQEMLKPLYDEKEKIASGFRKINSNSLETEIDETEMTINTIQRSIIQKELDIASKESKEFDDTQIFLYEKKERDYAIKLNNLQNELQTLSENQEIYEFWKLAFSPKGIPSMLIDEAIPFMNSKVSEYLERLTNGRYIVSFDTLAETKGGEFRDKISVNVLDTHTRANSRIQLSGGQTRIIDIATILTLGDLQSNVQDVKFNILLFDEIFDSLDDENIGFVSKVLSNMRIGKSIYLISHRHEDQLEADEVLTLN